MLISDTCTIERPGEFRLLLQSEYLQRLDVNSQYSLRAFSQYLGIHSGTLSQIIAGKRKAGKALVEKLCNKLELSPVETKKYVDKTSKVNLKNNKSDKELEDFQQITLDTFNMMSEWYYMSILELTKVSSFKPCPQWISEKLLIKPQQARAAVEALLRLGLLAEKDGTWVHPQVSIRAIGEEYKTAALRKMQRQILNKAKAALDEIPFEQRHQSSLTIAMDKELLPEVIQRIHKFRSQLNDFIENSSNKNNVYKLSFTAFPVTVNKENEE